MIGTIPKVKRTSESFVISDNTIRFVQRKIETAENSDARIGREEWMTNLMYARLERP